MPTKPKILQHPSAVIYLDEEDTYPTARRLKERNKHVSQQLKHDSVLIKECENCHGRMTVKWFHT